MKHLSILIKPSSALCNLRCRYCFYADISNLRKVPSFGKMDSTVLTKMIDRIYLDLEDGDHMTFAFQGGEPTLAGLSYFREFIKYVKTKKQKVDISYSLQTNGILIDEKWCAFLKENNFLVGLSLDGGIEFHDNNRLDAKGQGTYQQVMGVKRLFDQYQIDYNVLSVLTKQNAQHPQEVFAFLLKENIRYVQFIPCLDNLKMEQPSDCALQPHHFANFYKGLYPLWEREFLSGNYISINLFDHIVSLLAKGIVGSCGMLGQCQNQYVIEANGNVYPCDFYVLDQYYLGNITEKRLTGLSQSPVLKEFLEGGREELCSYCKKCSFIKMCYGGCKRMKHTMYLNNTEMYCGYQNFLNTHFDSIQKIVNTLTGQGTNDKQQRVGDCRCL